MSRFFFHLHHCGAFIADEEGQDLPNLEVAIARAKVAARGLLAEEISAGKLCLGCWIEVVEADTGRSVTIPFSATVELESAIFETIKA